MIDARLLRRALAADPTWATQFDDAWERATTRVHLAVFVEPFLQYVLDGSKTVESRFSVKATAPYDRVAPGDILLLKRSGGPVVGVCRVADVWQYELDAATWRYIKQQFARALRVDGSNFLEQKSHASFATLIRIDQVLPIQAVPCEKRDRRGWVVLRDLESQRTLFADAKRT